MQHLTQEGVSAVADLRVVVGSDPAGQQHKDALVEHLRCHADVSNVIDVGVKPHEKTHYPGVAFHAARLITEGCADRALLICHTGLGMAIAANKVPEIRAVTAHDTYSVRCSVLSNDAQVLTLGQGIVGLAVARQLVDEWLAYCFDPACSAAAKVSAIRAFETAIRAEGENRRGH
jgi:ribose 5-phosphate isomerase B